MKRAIIVLAILGVGVCIGTAADEVVKKFPWASDEMNKPCDKTELEWRCLGKAMKNPDTTLAGLVSVEAFTVEPRSGGFSFTVVVEQLPEAGGKMKQFKSQDEAKAAIKKVAKQWGTEQVKNMKLATGFYTIHSTILMGGKEL